MKKKVIICLVILVLISFVFYITSNFIQFEGEKQKSSIPVVYLEEDNEQNKEKITNIVENQGLEADDSIYEKATEYDGREVVIIKSSVQYKVALAGMIKKGKTEFSEINEVLKQAPTHTGIWIEENSREKFLNILKKITNANYEINKDGFLKQTKTWNMNEYDKKIEQMLLDEQLHIFDISSITYIVDTVTGEIQEYPFEEMDPYNEYEYLSSENKEMFIISENSLGKINQEEVLKSIFSIRDGS